DPADGLALGNSVYRIQFDDEFPEEFGFEALSMELCFRSLFLSEGNTLPVSINEINSEVFIMNREIATSTAHPNYGLLHWEPDPYVIVVHGPLQVLTTT
ncbi:hypothetical protein Tco_1372245, partial [Tanacetum coccineum]